MKFPKCEKCAIKLLRRGGATAFVLALSKGFIGIIGGSFALMASGLVSLEIAALAFLTLLDRRISKRALTGKYPYGFGKIRFVYAVFSDAVVGLASASLLLVSIINLGIEAP